MKVLLGLSVLVGLAIGGVVAWPILELDVGPSLKGAEHDLQSQVGPTRSGAAHSNSRPPGSPNPASRDQLRTVAAADIPGLVEVDVDYHYTSDDSCTGWPVGSGYFVTAYHCVYGTAAAPGAVGRLLGEGVAVTALTPSGSVADGNFNATVVATDPAHDLALLELGGVNLAAWPHLDRGLPLDLKPVSTGQLLVALDFHAVNQRPFVAYGQVIDPNFDASPDPAADEYPGAPNDYQDVIEVAATAYPGNSGGPVLNARGRVVGVVDLGGKDDSTFEAMPIAVVGSEIERWLAR